MSQEFRAFSYSYPISGILSLEINAAMIVITPLNSVLNPTFSNMLSPTLLLDCTQIQCCTFVICLPSIFWATYPKPESSGVLKPIPVLIGWKEERHPFTEQTYKHTVTPRGNFTSPVHRNCMSFKTAGLWEEPGDHGRSPHKPRENFTQKEQYKI